MLREQKEPLRAIRIRRQLDRTPARKEGQGGAEVFPHSIKKLPQLPRVA